MTARDAIVTGIGLVTSLAEGGEATLAALVAGREPVVDGTTTAPFPFHPGLTLDLDKQIPRKGDQRQMEPWQRLGTYAAGLALSDAGVAGNEALLARTHMIVAATGGERDIAVDESIMAGLAAAPNVASYLNERLANDLRPTLFLAQLSNLLAGNISIVHRVTGSSRTFMGEESAGVDAVRTMVARIGAGQVDIGLVGAACAVQRPDILLMLAAGGALWRHPWAPVWSRGERGGGLVLGSVGAFLVIEALAHAEARGAQQRARIAAVVSGNRDLPALDVPAGPLAVLSGATGAEPATRQERAYLDSLRTRHALTVRATGSRIGHGVEATPFANVALAALMIDSGQGLPPFEPGTVETPADGPPERVLVTSFGHSRGTGFVLIDRAGGR